MLHVQLHMDNTPSMNIEAEFSGISLTLSEYEKKAISVIDKGTAKDANTFIDRFGAVLYTSCLSTGCKAAILVYLKPDLTVDLIECGDNARDFILGNCVNGHVLMYWPNSPLTGSTCDIEFSGFHFTSIPRLYRFIWRNEWRNGLNPEDPEGVEVISTESSSAN